MCSKNDIPCVRRMTFLAFDERHSLCSKKDIPCVRRNNTPSVRRKNIPCVRRTTFLVFKNDETPIFGRTDLRKGVSEAKFDGQADFDVKKCLAPPKSAENRKKPKKNPKKFPKKFFRRRKIESCKSSETRFPEVSRRSEPSSRGERRKKFAWSQVFTPKQNRNG